MSSSRAVLEVDGLSAAWDRTPVLRNLSFALGAGELLAVLGPNGSGKTTLLRCLAGLERPTGGSVRLDGRPIDRQPAHRRGIGLMAQEPALFPHRTVLENVAYGPLLARRPEAEVRADVGRLLTLLRLDGFEDRRPDRLSGGERQRVALARTLAARPRVVLLDEPFASIDVELRAELRAEFRRVLAELGTAAIHVTHDREEGLFLGDRVALLLDGAFVSVGPPQEVFDRPPDARAARLLGYNVVRMDGETLAVHPAELDLVDRSAGRRPGVVVVVGSTGRERLTTVQLDDGQRLEVRGPLDRPAPAAGTPVGVSWRRALAFGSTPASDPKEPKWSPELDHR